MMALHWQNVAPGRCCESLARGRQLMRLQLVGIQAPLLGRVLIVLSASDIARAELGVDCTGLSPRLSLVRVAPATVDF